MVSSDSPTQLVRPGRLLVVVAHPGDADEGMAGSVARWVGEGTVAHLVCSTSGEAGSDDIDTDPLVLAAAREAEQRAAAAIVGYDGVTYLHRPDGALVNDLALREQLVRIIRSFRPDAVASTDPRVIVSPDGFIQHVDHREVGAAAIDAAYPAAGDALAFPQLVKSEGLAPHRVARLLLFWSSQPSAWVDISASLDIKLGALRAHASQRRAEGLEDDVRAEARREGERVGLDSAETYAAIDLRQLADRRR